MFSNTYRRVLFLSTFSVCLTLFLAWLEFYVASPTWTVLYERTKWLLLQSNNSIHGQFSASDHRFVAYQRLFWYGTPLLAITVPAAAIFHRQRLDVALKYLDAFLGAVTFLLLSTIFLVIGTEQFGFLSENYARPPAEVWWHFVGYLHAYSIAAVPTTFRLIAGSVLGLLIAVPIGLVLARSQILGGWFSFWLVLLAPLPPLLLKPILTLSVPSQRNSLTWIYDLVIAPESLMVRTVSAPIRWVSAVLNIQQFQQPAPSVDANLTKSELILVLIVAWCVVWPILQAVLHTSAHTPTLEHTVQVARLSGASRPRSIIQIHLPQLTPAIAGAIWSGVVIAFIVLIGIDESSPVQVLVAEDQGSTGLAQVIHDSLTGGGATSFAYPVILFSMLYMFLIRACLFAATIPMLRWKYHRRRNLPTASVLPTDLETFIAFKVCHLRGELPLTMLGRLLVRSGLAPRRPARSPKSFLRIQKLKKTYAKLVLDVPDLEVRAGEAISIIGRSGEGKSTFVRVISGLESPDREAGSVDVLGQALWQGSKRIARNRNLGIAFVFQDYALFPTRTVYENVVFPLKCEHLDPRAYAPAVDGLLRIFGLSRWSRCYPHELSGGTQQRVALARALATNARLLILDEPLSAIDQPKKDELVDLITAFRVGCGEAGEFVTTISVSHDNKEVLRSSTRVIYLHDTHIAEDASPRSLFLAPKDPSVAHFIGHANIFLGRFESFASPRFEVIASLDRLSGEMRKHNTVWPLNLTEPPAPDGAEITIVVPKNWISSRTSAGSRSKWLKEPLLIRGTVSAVEFCGTHIECSIWCPDLEAAFVAAMPEDEFRAICPDYFVDGSIPPVVALHVNDLIVIRTTETAGALAV